jgi:hypothetical protein
MTMYRVTVPLELGFDREPTAGQVAAMVARVEDVLVDSYGPPLDSEGAERFDGYDGPFLRRVRVGEA